MSTAKRKIEAVAGAGFAAGAAGALLYLVTPENVKPRRGTGAQIDGLPHDPSLPRLVENEVFFPDTEIDTDKIEVSAENGSFYLRGEVSSSAEAADLRRAAERVVGPVVEDRLRLAI